MKIALGSDSKSKLSILQMTLRELSIKADIIRISVESGISEQPLSKKETMLGALNRAKAAFLLGKPVDFALGMEAGLELINNNYSLICTAVLVNGTGNTYTGESSLYPLPGNLSNLIKQGKEFGIEAKKLIKHYDAISKEYLILNRLIKRDIEFSEALKQALNQL